MQGVHFTRETPIPRPKMSLIAADDEDATRSEATSSEADESDSSSGDELPGRHAPLITYTTIEEKDAFNPNKKGDPQTLQYHRAINAIYDEYIDKTKRLEFQRVAMDK